MRLPSFLWTFKSRLLVFLLAGFAPVFAFLVYHAARDREAVEANAVRDISVLVDTIRADYQGNLAQGRQLGALLAEIRQVRNGNPAECSRLLASIEPSYAPFPQIAVADREGRIYCSARRFAESTGVSDRRYFRNAVERRQFTVSEPLLGRASKRPVLVLATPIRDAGGAVQGVVIVSLDLAWVSSTLARFKLPPESTVGVSDNDGVLIARYPEPANLVGQSIRDTSFFGRMRGRDASGSFEQMGLDGVRRLFVYARHETEGGGLVIWAGVPVDAVYGPIRSAFAIQLAYLAVGVLAVALGAWRLGRYVLLDPLATERKAYKERVRHAATHDNLTDLPNRALLLDRIGQALPLARRSGRHLAVMAFNIDRLKYVNESLGHDVGDAVLRAFAAKLGEQLRPGDTVARLGGDDFAILLSDLHRAEDAAVVGQKLLDALAAPLDAAGNSLSVSASIGIAIYPEDGDNGLTLLRNADAAMHRAKAEGGRSIRFFTEKLAARARQRLAVEQALVRALELRQLFLHYQPQIDARTGRMTGAEALIRWQDPELGLVPPAHFIPVAEETGLIVPLGEWVLREACMQTMRWRQEGLAPIRIGVNLSARQFWHGKLGPQVQSVLDETGLPPELLELEVTESVVMHDAEETVATLGALKSLGLTIAVDDFGTGYSSLAYLRRYPIDRLKIDRSFVNDMEADPRAATLIQGVIGLAHGLDFRVVAEGVETSEQARLLRLLRCDELQGYWIAKPLTADKFRSLLQANRAWDLSPPETRQFAAV